MFNSPCNQCQQRQATHYIVDVAGGIKRELYFCTTCINGLGLQIYSVPIVLLSNVVPVDVQCDRCGMTLSQYNKTQRVGCPNDYELFNLGPILEKYHNSSQHVGKVPRPSIEEEITTLKAALASAISREHYEQAAQIRDLIKLKEQV